MGSKDGFFKLDWGLLLAVVALSVIGILMIYSAGFDSIEKVNSGLYKRQIAWFIIGFIIMIGITFLNYQSLGDYSIQIYVFFLVVLLLTSLFAPPVRNIRAWINFGFFSVQPSEFMKLALVAIIGKYLELRERDIRDFRELFIPALITLVPMLVILMQPDLGTAIIFFPILFAMLFVGGADISHLVAITSIALIALVVPMALTYLEWIGAEESTILIDFFKDSSLLFVISGVLLFAAAGAFLLNFFFRNALYRLIYIPASVISFGLFFSVLIQKFFMDYQKKRILVFLNPDLDPYGSGYNIIQSKIAIGSGGFAGKGFLRGSQSQLGFLPEKTSDFIFPVIAEEWGFIGSIIVLFLLGFIIYRGLRIAFESKDKFGALLAGGITSIFFLHIIINIGMVIGIMPVTGLPLPFLSYGGSNYLVSMIAIGILLNINSRKYVY
jgi:rod shape determining protein RodA